jgi:hypothetical protein
VALLTLLCLLVILLTIALVRAEQKYKKLSSSYYSQKMVTDQLEYFSKSILSFTEAIRKALDPSRPDLQSWMPPQHHLVNGLESGAIRIADFFSRISGHECHVVIKELFFAHRHATGRREPAVRTLARSEATTRVPPVTESVSLARQFAEGEAVPWGYDIAWVEDNSDFKCLFNQDVEYFLENDIPTAFMNGSLKDSHLEAGMSGTDTFPYKSTVIWAIKGNRNEVQPPFMGFLCVYSKDQGVFDIQRDSPFARVVSAVLCRVLVELLNSYFTASYLRTNGINP